MSVVSSGWKQVAIRLFCLTATVSPSFRVANTCTSGLSTERILGDLRNIPWYSSGCSAFLEVVRGACDSMVVKDWLPWRAGSLSFRVASKLSTCRPNELRDVVTSSPPICVP